MHTLLNGTRAQMRVVRDHKREQPHKKRKAFQDELNKPESEVSKYLNRKGTQNVDPLKMKYCFQISLFNKKFFINKSKNIFSTAGNC